MIDPIRFLGRCGLAALAILLAACAGPALRTGASEPEVLAALGAPTGRYALPDGLERLEFARGPYGRVTWMVDLDAAGRVLRWEQVLDAAHFARVSDGMTREQLLRLLGRPADRAGEWQDRVTWSWRYETSECLWFRVTLSADGSVINGGAYMTDPRCDARDRGRD
jgi:hypothetical protein